MRLPRADVDVAAAVEVRAGDAEHAPGEGLLAHDARHPVLQQDLHALGPRAALERAHQARAGRVVDGLAEVLRPGDHGLPAEGERALGRHAVRPRVDELHAVLHQEVERLDVVVREGAHHLAVVVARVDVVGPRVLQVHLVGRVLDAVPLLHAGPAAQRHAALADHAVAADVEVLLDDDDRRAEIAGANRRRQARGARAHHDDVGLTVPGRLLRRRRARRQTGQRGRAHARGAAADERPAADGRLGPLTAHVSSPCPTPGRQTSPGCFAWRPTNPAGVRAVLRRRRPTRSRPARCTESGTARSRARSRTWPRRRRRTSPPSPSTPASSPRRS